MTTGELQPTEAERHNLYLDEIRSPSTVAARRILPLLLERFEINSVLDVGCGTGAWLAVAREMGANRLTGVDATWAEDWLDEDGMIGSRDFDFVEHDLRERLKLDDRFDLAMSLEVAQHFTDARAASFVEDLCATAPRVLFSSAVPLQYPPLESIMINNRWQSYWAGHFADCGYLPMDVIRPVIWNDDVIPDYYRQNMLVYVTESEHDARLEPMMLDVVHPSCWDRRAVEALDAKKPRRLGLRARLRIAGGIPRETARAAKRRWNARD